MQGGAQDVPTDPNWYYLDTETREWRAVEPPKEGSPVPRSGHTANLVGESRIYILGGRGHRDEYNELWVFDASTYPFKYTLCHNST